MSTEQQREYDHFIAGEYVSPANDEYFRTIDPATEKRIADVAEGTSTDVDRAVESATNAFQTWRDTEPVERGRVLHDIASAIRNNESELAELESLDQGKPISQARSNVKTTARYFEYYAGMADKIEGKSIPKGASNVDFTVRVPYGVSAQITPWNFPISLAGRGIAPALVAGNTVVVKPAPTTPLSTLRLAEIAHSTALPDGAVNAVAGGVEAGRSLSSHPDVDVLTFTGSIPTGKAVMESAAQTITPVTLELGGKNPAIVLPDADMDTAVSSIANGIFHNGGQICSAADRALVHESVYDEFIDRIVESAESYELGKGIDDPDMGPLNNTDQLEKTLEYIDIGKEEGATLETGGHEIDRDGYFVAPTVFSDVDHSMRIAQEEIFGPVLSIIPFSDVEDAIRIANDTKYGLTGAVFSRDVTRALSVARDIEAGGVAVNEWFGGGMGTPFGGFKESGIGREGGSEGLDSYLQTKNFSINIG
ncbi:aldehyde dehydrogenase family protein [Natrarchaeobius chitinivorans]|uniref:Aldehyde dehydrogenase n=1 Tax=Natrarchaeobius chitinivorans TaxID=1679083 RepID=A0A3N6MFF4_NATCH|nr:aldehyde dehydrogenase family protein [Natrarchaeobius chitinivorans]RQG95460.1 aldehyde dehydrogenase [Natrarchaeobius chitinivorans]